ncbi:amidohydrolase/deacetylase family metallohydrolase [Enemella sp. A6]|uniref:amidohydrolase/deacetylase family metallohydrolase n=1 Tax=Enemella sp. A6 TaxID=3440152 RepID=UPI003EBE443F
MTRGTVLTNCTFPEAHRDEVSGTEIAFADGKIVAQPDDDWERIDVEGAYVTPGFIDQHVHVFLPAKTLGIPADRIGVNQGVTTVVDAGSSGARDFDRFEHDVIDTQRTNVLAWLNIASSGLVDDRHELVDLANIDPDKSFETIRAHSDRIIGLKVRMSASVLGSNGLKPLQMARELADAVRLPIMIHTGNRPPEMGECLDLLRAGDVCSHAFHGKPGGLFDETGRLDPRAVEAKERGVLFDVGHGQASLSFEVARAAREAGLPADTISTDLHEGNVDGPVYSLAETMSKMLALGYPLEDVIAAVTTRPAAAIGRPDLASLAPGSTADLSVFEIRHTDREFRDSQGATLPGREVVRPRRVVRGDDVHGCE